VQAAKLGLGEIVHGRGKLPGFAIVKLDGTRVLFAAPDHFCFLFAAALREDVRRDGNGGYKH
jgi:hypothetical protein